MSRKQLLVFGLASVMALSSLPARSYSQALGRMNKPISETLFKSGASKLSSLLDELKRSAQEKDYRGVAKTARKLLRLGDGSNEKEYCEAMRQAAIEMTNVAGKSGDKKLDMQLADFGFEFASRVFPRE